MFCAADLTLCLPQNNALVKSDLDGDLAKPSSAIGMIVAALRQRRAKGTPSFTVLSCDNLPENGDKVCVGIFLASIDRASRLTNNEHTPLVAGMKTSNARNNVVQPGEALSRSARARSFSLFLARRESLIVTTLCLLS